MYMYVYVYVYVYCMLLHVISGFKKIHVAYLLVCRRGKRDENNQNVCVCVAHQTNVRVWFVSDEFYKVALHWAITV